jgi:hypothetical protein
MQSQINTREANLVRYASKLFPINDTTPVSAVRHLRRHWVRSVMYLRKQSKTGWTVDNKIEKSNDEAI